MAARQRLDLHIRPVGVFDGQEEGSSTIVRVISAIAIHFSLSPIAEDGPLSLCHLEKTFGKHSRPQVETTIMLSCPFVIHGKVMFIDLHPIWCSALLHCQLARFNTRPIVRLPPIQHI